MMCISCESLMCIASKGFTSALYIINLMSLQKVPGNPTCFLLGPDTVT